MEKEKIKNIVVLRNLPSNYIEEAFIVCKTKTFAKKIEMLEKNNLSIKNNEKLQKKDLIEEAEDVILNYIDKIEKEKKFKDYNKIKIKNDRLTTISIFISIYAILTTIALILV